MNEAPDTLIIGGVVLNPWKNTVKVLSSDRTVTLTMNEFRIFSVIVKQEGQFIQRPEILKQIESGHVTERTVDAHICYLRKKLPEAMIISVSNKGYRFGGTT